MREYEDSEFDYSEPPDDYEHLFHPGPAPAPQRDVDSEGASAPVRQARPGELSFARASEESDSQERAGEGSGQGNSRREDSEFAVSEFEDSEFKESEFLDQGAGVPPEHIDQGSYVQDDHQGPPPAPSGEPAEGSPGGDYEYHDGAESVRIIQAGETAAPAPSPPAPSPPQSPPSSPAPSPPATPSQPRPVAQPADQPGRLFRSLGATPIPDVLPAMSPSQARRLRSMERDLDPAASQAAAHAAPIGAPREVPERFAARTGLSQPDPPPREYAPPGRLEDPYGFAPQPPQGAPALVFDGLADPPPVFASGEPTPAQEVMGSPAPSRDSGKGRPRRSKTIRSRQGNLTALGVYVIVSVTALILAFIQTLLLSSGPGLLAGIGLMLVSVFCAFAVRRDDALAAVFAPAIAFLLVALTAGQIGTTARDVPERAVVIFELLGSNWVWIIGSTVAALIVVTLRRRSR